MHPVECRRLPAVNAVRSALVLALLLAALERELVGATAAEYCPDTQSEIQTDRPDVTNSSLVVQTAAFRRRMASI